MNTGLNNYLVAWDFAQIIIIWLQAFGLLLIGQLIKD